MIRRLLGDLYGRVWAKADDAVVHREDFGDLYLNVPEHLQERKVWVLELHFFEDEDRQALLNWLERDDDT